MPSYTVKRGDSLSAIAAQMGVPVSQLSGYRSGNPNLIYPGETIKVGSSAPTNYGMSTAPRMSTQPAPMSRQTPMSVPPPTTARPTPAPVPTPSMAKNSLQASPMQQSTPGFTASNMPWSKSFAATNDGSGTVPATAPLGVPPIPNILSANKNQFNSGANQNNNAQPLGWLSDAASRLNPLGVTTAYASNSQSASPAPTPQPNRVQQAQKDLDRAKQEQVDIEKDRKRAQQVVQKTIKIVPEMFRQNAISNIPLIVKALKEQGILSPNVLAYALATIQHETAGRFSPIEEFGGRQQARKLGYSGGENFYGRGFIQLTHDHNYKKYGDMLGLDLVNNPNLALDPEVSARILASFFKNEGVAQIADSGDFFGARKPVNGYDQASYISQLANLYAQNLPYDLE